MSLGAALTFRSHVMESREIRPRKRFTLNKAPVGGKLLTHNKGITNNVTATSRHLEG